MKLGNVLKVRFTDIDLTNRELTALPKRSWGNVNNFSCNGNFITSLVGAPKRVNEDFACSGNKLTSLNGAPVHVGENFRCNNNRLVSLIGAPTFVGNDFHCFSNQLVSLDGVPRHIGGEFICNDNPIIRNIIQLLKTTGISNFLYDDCPEPAIEAFKILEKYYTQDGAGDIIAFQKELIKAGLRDFAR